MASASLAGNGAGLSGTSCSNGVTGRVAENLIEVAATLVKCSEQPRLIRLICVSEFDAVCCGWVQ